MSSWYQVGFQSAPPSNNSTQVRDFPPRRFWVEAESSKELIFIDDSPFCFYEHQLDINGTWDNYVTCLNGTGEDCPTCELLGPKKRYYVGLYTVIDCSKWKDKKGVDHQYDLKLFAAKTKTLKKLTRKKEDRGALAGWIVRAHREDNKSPSCGDDFEFIKEIKLEEYFSVTSLWGQKLPELYKKASAEKESMEKLKKTLDLTLNKDKKLVERIHPFNYMSLCKPKTVAELKELLKGVTAPTPSNGTTTDGPRVDVTVPF